MCWAYLQKEERGKSTEERREKQGRASQEWKPSSRVVFASYLSTSSQISKATWTSKPWVCIKHEKLSSRCLNKIMKAPKDGVQISEACNRLKQFQNGTSGANTARTKCSVARPWTDSSKAPKGKANETLELISITPHTQLATGAAVPKLLGFT